jgi:tetratricopeptide (TPR) repeat protein
MTAGLPWAVGAALSLAVAVASAGVVRSYPARELDVNMLFVPSPLLVKGAATGYENMLADSLWLTLLQYYGERFFQEERVFVNLEDMFGLITDLDPKFWFAYWLGAWALGDDKQPEAALRLLEKGERLNPDYLHYPYLQGFIRFLYLGDYAGAAKCFERAATRPIAEWEDQKRFARSLAARMYQRQGQDQLALQIWVEMAKSADKTTADIARRNVARIKAELAGERKGVFTPAAPEPGSLR